jgi:hypothetical protein
MKGKSDGNIAVDAKVGVLEGEESGSFCGMAGASTVVEISDVS